MEEMRNNLIDTAQTIKCLALGTRGILWDILFGYVDELALRAIYHYKLAYAAPLSFAEKPSPRNASSGKKCALTYSQPLPPSYNTSAHDDESMACDLSPAPSPPWRNTLTQRGKKKLDRLTEQGISSFEFMARNPECGRRFGAGKRYLSSGLHWDLGRGHEWAGLDSPGAVLVDVGGGHGTVSQYLARETRHVETYLPGTVEARRKILPDDLRSRVRFMEHDFFTEQPVREADVDFFRWILRDWSDGYCGKILRALKKGNRVLVCWWRGQRRGQLRYVKVHGKRIIREWESRFYDVGTVQFLRAHGEDVGCADQRLRLLRCEIPEGSLFGIIEAVRDGGD
ncbi:O- family 2 protein [Rutstroemia sp. NJR-2017a WRK4]|nr:O- family 2 protein [Rutstroemia sp. NJR-2017a WRK4]